MKLIHTILNSIKPAALLAPNGSWEITGGTGRFAGASGSSTTKGGVDSISATVGLGHATMDGISSSPGNL